MRVRYIAVDISPNMIEAAKRTISKRFPDIEILSFLFDFEKGEVLQDILKLTRAPRTRNYFFLLGNTLGNFDNTDKVLSNLKLSMFPNDALVIGNQISNSLASQRFVEYYRTREAFDLVSSTLTDYGMRCSFEEYSVRWNSLQKQIEVFLTMRSNKRITLAGHDVSFEKGEELLLAVSKKFAEETLATTFNSVGFRMDFFSVNRKKNVCIASVRPTRFHS